MMFIDVHVHEVKEQSNNTKQTTTVTVPLHPTINSADVDVGAGVVNYLFQFHLSSQACNKYLAGGCL